MKSYVSPKDLLLHIKRLEAAVRLFADRPLSRAEAATQLGITIRTLDRKIKDGLIRATVTEDGVRYIFQSELNRYAKGDICTPKAQRQHEIAEAEMAAAYYLQLSQSPGQSS